VRGHRAFSGAMSAEKSWHFYRLELAKIVGVRVSSLLLKIGPVRLRNSRRHKGPLELELEFR